MFTPLGVPYRSQNASGAWRFGSDCGPACVAMLLDWVRRANGWSIDQLAAQTALAVSDTGLMPDRLPILGALHELSLTVGGGLTLDWLYTEVVGRKRPVIPLIAYRWITGRWDQADKYAGSDGHFVVVTNVSSTTITVNDPDWLNAGGKAFRIPRAQFQVAFAEYGGWGVYFKTMTAKDEAIARIQDALAAVSAIQEAAVTPTPNVGTTVWCATTKLNVRDAPGVSGTPVAWLTKYDSVQATDCGNGWWKIDSGQVRTDDGLVDVTTVAQKLYASGAYLSTTRPT